MENLIIQKKQSKTVKLNNIKSKINDIVTEESLKKYMIDEINKVEINGKFITSENMFRGEYNNSGQIITLVIEFIFSNLSFTIKYDEKNFKTIKYFKLSDKYEVDYTLSKINTVIINEEIFETEELEKIRKTYSKSGKLLSEENDLSQDGLYIEIENAESKQIKTKCIKPKF